ncbi:MAG: hypothetical protein HY735_24430 [Verrucomicrobia bacterium]|nr:hypothetical protein [Verrucomicrobiota bacterium]
MAAFLHMCMAAIRLLASLLIVQASAQEVRDDFNDANDAGWTRHSPLAQFGSSGAFSFPNGGYRIQTTAPSPDPDSFGPGRAYSVRSEVYSDFYIEVDIVNWDNNLPQAFGILARVATPGLGTTTGYAFSWDRGDTPNSGNVDLVRIDQERTTHLSPSGEEDIQLQPGKQYRFVFIGRGPSLEGRIFELPDANRATLTVSASDATYASGRAGLLAVDDSDGLDRTADVTFDNFFATDRELKLTPLVPPTLTIQHDTAGRILISWPATAVSFILEETDDLSLQASWQPARVSPALAGDLNRILLPASTTSKFYRLRRP